MAEDYYWPANVVNELTFYQVRMYLCDEKQLTMRISGTHAEVEVAVAKFKQQGEGLVRGMLEGLNRGGW